MTLTPQLAFDDERFEDLIATISERFSILPAYKTEFAQKIEHCLLQNNITIEEDDGIDGEATKLDALFEKAKAITPHLTREEFTRLIDPTQTLIAEEKKEFVPLIPRIKKRFRSKKEEETHSVTLEKVAQTIEEKFAMVSFEIDSILAPATASLKESIKQVIKETIHQGKTTNITAADYDYLVQLQAKQQLLSSKEREFAHLAQDIYASNDLHHTPPLKEAMLGPYEADIAAWKKKGLPSQRRETEDGRHISREENQQILQYYTAWKNVLGNVSWLDKVVWSTTNEERRVIDNIIQKNDTKSMSIVSGILDFEKTKRLLILYLLDANIGVERIDRMTKYATPAQIHVLSQFASKNAGKGVDQIKTIFDWDAQDGCLIIESDPYLKYKLHDVVNKNHSRDHYFLKNLDGGLGCDESLRSILSQGTLKDDFRLLEAHERGQIIQQGAKVFGNMNRDVLKGFLICKKIWTNSYQTDLLLDPVRGYIDLETMKVKFKDFGRAGVCVMTKCLRK